MCERASQRERKRERSERVSGGQPQKTLYSLKASLAGVIRVLTLPHVPEGLLCASARVLAEAYKTPPMK